MTDTPHPKSLTIYLDIPGVSVRISILAESDFQLETDDSEL